MSAIGFCIPVYTGRAVLCLTRDAYIKARKQFEEFGPERDLKATYGLFVPLRDEKKNERVYLIGWFDRKPATLVHELAHMTFEILTYSGVPISKRNDEAFAYLIDALFAASIDASKRVRRGRKQ